MTSRVSFVIRQSFFYIFSCTRFLKKINFCLWFGDNTRWNKQNNVTKYAEYIIVYLPHKFVVTKNIIEFKKKPIFLKYWHWWFTSPEMAVTWKRAFPVLLVGCNLSWQPCRVACKCLPIRTSCSNNSPSTSRSTATSRRGNMRLSCYSIKVRNCDILTNWL